MPYQPSLFDYDYSQGMPPRPDNWPPISWEEMNVGNLSSELPTIDASNPQLMTAGFSWPFGGTNEYATTRPSGIDTPMNYQDQIRTLPGGNYQGWKDRIQDTDLMVNQEYEQSLQDINTNPLYDDTETYMKEPGETLFAENWRLNDLNPFKKDNRNMFGYQKRPGEGLAGLFQRPAAKQTAYDAIMGSQDDQGYGIYKGNKYKIQDGKIYSEVDPSGWNFDSGWGSKSIEEREEKTLSKAMARLAAGKAISTRLRNILQNRGMLTPTGTDRIGGDSSIPIGPISTGEATGGYGGPPTTSFNRAQAAKAGSYNQRAGPMPGGGSYGPWKAEGGRIGYANGEFVDEDVNIQGPGFDVNENIEMTSGGGEGDILEQLVAKYIEAGFPPDQAQAMAMQELQQMVAQSGQGEGIASLV